MTGDSLPLDPPLLERLHARSGAVRWHVSTARFGAAIAAAVEKRFPQGTERGAVEAFVDGLHLEDLALAVGCAEGHELAWETFDARYRVDLRRAAAARTGETDGDEIVDALFVDLFARGDGSGRRSLFEYFHGRSKLGTWLRTLVAQRQVDRHRATRRFESLDAAPEGTEAVPAPAADPDPDRDRLVAELHAALDRGVAALAPRDRLRLACYHADGLTLAAIGRLLNEHEATVSRKLQRARDALRAAVDAHLTAELGLTPGEVRVCYERAIEAGGVELERLRLVAPVAER